MEMFSWYIFLSSGNESYKNAFISRYHLGIFVILADWSDCLTLNNSAIFNIIHFRILTLFSIKIKKRISWMWYKNLKHGNMKAHLFFFVSKDTRYSPMFPYFHVRKIFFLSGFSFTTIHELQDRRGRGRASL